MGTSIPLTEMHEIQTKTKPLSGIVLVLVWCVYMYNRFSGRVSVIVQYKVGHSVGCLPVLLFLPNAHHLPNSILE